VGRSPPPSNNTGRLPPGRLPPPRNTTGPGTPPRGARPPLPEARDILPRKGSRASSGGGYWINQRRQDPPPQFPQATPPLPAVRTPSAPLQRPPPEEASVCAAGSSPKQAHEQSSRLQ
jgi:hypothetical protein